MGETYVTVKSALNTRNFIFHFCKEDKIVFDDLIIAHFVNIK
jgi:hypothetical protein